jgi:hypothetical protein
MTTKQTSKKPIAKKECLKCLKEQPSSNFYNTADTELFSDSKMPICKPCCYIHIDDKGFEGFQAIMRLINKPIYEDLFKGDYKDYIRQINSLGQYKNTYYNNSDMFRENKSLELVKRTKPKELTAEEMQDAEDFFGFGFSEHDYMFLLREFDEFGAQYDISSKALENLIREICLTQLEIRTKRSSKQDVKNELKTLQDLLGSSNLKPMQESGALSQDQESYSTLIKKWENERPIPEPSPEWADVDNIGKYIRTFFLGHLSKVFGKENPYQEEYDEIIEEHTVRPPKRDDD